MRNILTFISLILALTQLKAQHFYQITSGAAATFATKDKYRDDGLFERKLGLGTRFGINFNLRIGRRMELQLGGGTIFFTEKAKKENAFFVTSGNLTQQEVMRRNRYFFFELPLFVKYSFVKKNNFSYFFSCGIATNFLILSQSTTNQNAKITRRGDFSSRFPSVSLGLGTEYKIMDSMFLVIRPTYTYLFEPFSSFKKNYIGLDLGAKYPF